MKMKIIAWLKWFFALTMGFLFAYSLLTRINLFFLIPLYGKAFFWAFTGIAFTLLFFDLQNIFITTVKSHRLGMLLPIIVIILTGLFFGLAPYQRMPFRTTHKLTIQTTTDGLYLEGIYSPDQNLIDPSKFSIEGTISQQEDPELGFTLGPETRLSYQDSFSGGLSIRTNDLSSPILISWDGAENLIDPTINPFQNTQNQDKWLFLYDPETSQYSIEFPGNTWGTPSRFWALLGGLLPIADFVSLTLTFIGIGIILMRVSSKSALGKVSLKWIYAWSGLMVAILMSRLGIETAIPDINTWLSILIFLPPALYTIFVQLEILSEKKLIDFPQSKQIKIAGLKLSKLFTKFNQNRTIAWISLVLIAIIGTLALFKLTQDGMGVSGDSVHYMDGAKNMAAGLGYVRRIEVGNPVPITGFPPGFPFLLTSGILLGLSAEYAARILNLFLYFIYLLSSGWIVLHFTKRVLPSVLISFFSMMLLSMESIFSWVMSEPLFIVLSFLTIFLFIKFHKSEKTILFILLSLVSGYLILVRLAGLSLVGAIALLLLFRSGKKFIKKLWLASLYGFLAILPTLIFLYRNSRVAESISESRGLNFAVFIPEYWNIIFREVSSWLKLETFFIKENTGFIVLGTFTLFILVGYLLARFSKKWCNEHRMAVFLLDLTVLYIVLYIVMIVLNVVIFTPGQTVSGLSRYSVPLFPAFAIMTTILLSTFIIPRSNYPIKLLIAIILIFLLRVNTFDYLNFNQHVTKNFRAYTDIINSCEDNLDVFTSFPEGAEIYSNNCEFVYYASGISCNHLPLGYESYQEGSDLFHTIEDGNIVAIMNEYGSTPANINVLLAHLKPIDYQCMITFYQWPD